jgi:hypothetical protein
MKQSLLTLILICMPAIANAHAQNFVEKNDVIWKDRRVTSTVFGNRS